MGLTLFVTSTPTPTLTLSTPAPMSIGIPCSDKGWYARNIWDMVFYDSRLFIGCGNSSNGGPFPNSGPIKVWTYTDKAGWKSEFTVDEEQINKFVILDGKMIIPGHDARQSWQFGNWYTRDSNGWHKHRNIPNALHVYDITSYNGLMFAALGLENYGQAIATSANGGQTWKTQTAPVNASTSLANCTRGLPAPVVRVFGFFTIAGELYANTTPVETRVCASGSNAYAPLANAQPFLQWDGKNFDSANLALLPDKYSDLLVRPDVYDDKTIYLTAALVDDHQWVPINIYSVDSTLQPTQLHPPNCERPQDIKTYQTVLFVLCNHLLGSGTSSGWQITLESTCDLTHWDELVSFEQLAFARSFAFEAEEVFFGLGSDNSTIDKNIQVETGIVLKQPFQPPALCSNLN